MKIPLILIFFCIMTSTLFAGGYKYIPDPPTGPIKYGPRYYSYSPMPGIIGLDKNYIRPSFPIRKYYNDYQYYNRYSNPYIYQYPNYRWYLGY